MMDSDNPDLTFSQTVNNPVIPLYQLPKVFIIEFRDNTTRLRECHQLLSPLNKACNLTLSIKG